MLSAHGLFAVIETTLIAALRRTEEVSSCVSVPDAPKLVSLVIRQAQSRLKTDFES